MILRLDETQPTAAELELINLLRLIDEAPFRGKLHDLNRDPLRSKPILERIHQAVQEDVDLVKLLNGPLLAREAVFRTNADRYPSTVAVRLFPGTPIDCEFTNKGYAFLGGHLGLMWHTAANTAVQRRHRLYLAKNNIRFEGVFISINATHGNTEVLAVQMDLDLVGKRMHNAEIAFHASDLTLIAAGKPAFPKSYASWDYLQAEANPDAAVVAIDRKNPTVQTHHSCVDFVNAVGAAGYYYGRSTTVLGEPSTPLRSYVMLDDVARFVQDDLGLSYVLRLCSNEEVDSMIRRASEGMRTWSERYLDHIKNLKQLRLLNTVMMQQEAQAFTA